MSHDFIKAAKQLADAIRIQREYVRVFEECPKDEIDAALENFNRQFNRVEIQWTFTKGKDDNR
jgi:hypothetical protein